MNALTLSIAAILTLAATSTIVSLFVAPLVA